MKTRLHLPLVTALVAAAAGLLTALPSEAASFQFSQGGFDGGGQITGHFAGEDTDHDGWLFGYEISDFSLSFSGNAQVNAFTHALGNGSGPGNFAYRLGSTTFEATPYGGLWTMGMDGDNDGLHVMRYASFEFEALGVPGMVTDLLGGTFTRTDELLRVSPVPEPETWALMVVGLTGIGVHGWRRRTAHQRPQRRRASPRALPKLTPTEAPGLAAALERPLRRAAWALRDALAPRLGHRPSTV